jgi:hypothetical protein
MGDRMTNHQLMNAPRRFASEAEMVDVHQAMFGEAGRFCAETVIRYAGLFEGLHPLDFRVVLAPNELGAYMRHIGYARTKRAEHAPRYILGNRGVCGWQADGTIHITVSHQFMTDFLLHELTHHRQSALIEAGARASKRGVHRDAGWYGAIAEVAPRYLGVGFPEGVWPMQKAKPGRLSEVEATYWPHSLRKLIAAGDPRLRKSSVHDLATA